MEKAVSQCLTALQAYLTHKPVFHTQLSGLFSPFQIQACFSQPLQGEPRRGSVHAHMYLTLPDLQQQLTKAEMSNRRPLGGKGQLIANTAHFPCQRENRQGTLGYYTIMASSVHLLGAFHSHMSGTANSNGNPLPSSSAFSRTSAPLQS